MSGRGLSGARIARCAVFLALSFFVSWLMQAGKISRIVHPRMDVWVGTAGFAFLVLAFIQLVRIERKPRGPDAAGFYLAPLFMMAVVYLAVAASSRAPDQGGLRSAPDAAAVQKAFVDQRDKAFREAVTGPLPNDLILDDDHYWGVYNRIYDDPCAASGRRIEVSGFLVHDGRLPPGSVLVARNLMWCCSADMTQIGFIAVGKGIETLPRGAWVRAEGSLSCIDFDFDGDGKPSPVPVISLDGLAPVQPGSVSSTIFPY